MTHTTTQLDQIATGFLAIVTANRLDRATRALQVVLTAYAEGEIYNTAFKDAKDDLGRCVDEGFDAKTRRFRGYDSINPANREADHAFGWYLGFVSNLHNTLSLAKKLAKLKPTTTISTHTGAKASEVSPEFIQAAQEIANAAQPLALLFKELKPMIVKGRKPNPEAIARKAAELAKKDMKTCACCFRSIARLAHGVGNIADHGFTLPGRGWGRNGSCPGGNFRPLEISSEGLVYMVDGLLSRVAQLTAELEAAPDRKVFEVSKNYWSKETEEVTPEDPRFAELLRNYVSNVELNLQHTKSNLERFEKLLKEWKPTHTQDGKLIDA